MKAILPAAVVLLSPTVSVAEVSKGVDPAALRGWDIVVAEDAIESEVFAAQEFRHFHEQASGIELMTFEQVLQNADFPGRIHEERNPD